MALMLIIRSGPHTGREIRVARKTYLIGRAPECQLRPSSDQVSRKHCQISIEDPDVLVEDLGSGNGTLVNGVRLTERERLQNGDMVQVGPMMLEVVIMSLKPTGASALDDDASWVADGKPISTGDTQILMDNETIPDLAGPAPKLPPPAAAAPRRPSPLEALKRLQENHNLWTK